MTKERGFTLAELAKFDGTDGKVAFVGYQGKVYEVSGSSMFENGGHMGAHQAGADLTDAMAEAPPAEEVFDNFSPIGILKEE